MQSYELKIYIFIKILESARAVCVKSTVGMYRYLYIARGKLNNTVIKTERFKRGHIIV